MKIKNYKQLEEMKLRLRIKELEQEKAIHKSWTELKELLQPSTLIKNAFHTDKNEKGWLRTAISESLHALTNKTIETMQEKAEEKILEGADKLISKIEEKFKISG